MKNIFRLFMVLVSITALSTESKAQSFQVIAGDTISTTASLDTVSKVLSVTAGYSSLSFQIEGTRISGTVTAKAYLYVSNRPASGSNTLVNDNTGWILTDSTSAFSTGTNHYQFTKTPPPFRYYKVQVRNVGTTTSTEALALRFYCKLAKYD